MCGGVGTDQGPAAAQCDDQMLAGNGAAPRVWGAGVWPLASTRQTQAAAIFCNTSACCRYSTSYHRCFANPE